MKKVGLLILIGVPCMLAAQNATNKIDPERVIAEIDPRIFGVFMEPIQISGRRGLPDSLVINTLYGTLYNPAAKDADENGFRKVYIEAMK